MARNRWREFWARSARRNFCVPIVERLESRLAPALNIGFSNGFLNITASAAENVTLTTVGDFFVLNAVILKVPGGHGPNGELLREDTSSIRIAGNDSGTSPNLFQILDKNGGFGDIAISMFGGGGADRLFGDSNDLRVNFLLDGGSGNDFLRGGPGDDTMRGGFGDDVMEGAPGDDYLEGGAGVDVYAFAGFNDLDHDTVVEEDNNADWDMLDFSSLQAAINLNISSTSAQAVNELLTLTLSNGTGIERVNATRFADIVIGNACDNTMWGKGATDKTPAEVGDQLFGGAGHDDLFGDEGNDLIDGGGDEDDLSGNGGNDTLRGGDQNDHLAGGAGHDSLDGGAGDDDLEGGADNDTLLAGGGTNRLQGQDGDDSFAGGDGPSNLIDGGAGRDVLRSDVSNDWLIGGSGSDTFVFGQDELGSDRVTEATVAVDRDTLDFSQFPHAVTLKLGSTAGQVVAAGSLNLQLTNGMGIEDVILTPFDDFVTGNAAANRLDGRAGNDTFVGEGGDDSLIGDAGDDSLTGGLGNDSFIFAGAGLGADTVAEANGTGTHDRLDFVLFTGGGVWVNLAQTTQQVVAPGELNLTIVNNRAIEHVLGSDFNDVLVGNANDNLLYGRDGNDTVTGGLGNDSLLGGAALDVLRESGNVNFKLRDFVAGVASPVLGLMPVDARLDGSGADMLDGFELVELTGGVSANRLDAGAFSRMTILRGGSGNDTLIGGSNDDLLYGGLDNDVYAFGPALIGQSDTVHELFNEGIDRLDFSSLLASDPVTVNLNDSLELAQHTNREVLVGDDLLENAVGGAGNDRLTGNSRNNDLQGGFGTDTYCFVGDNLGFDTVVETGTFRDGDWLDLSKLNVHIVLDLASTSVQTFGASQLKLSSGVGFENVVGTPQNDVIAGNEGPNILLGGAGADVLLGLGGNDALDGQNDDDRVNGGAGIDQLFGGDGEDVLIAIDGAATDRAEGGDDRDVIWVDRVGATTDAVFDTDAAQFITAFANGADRTLNGDPIARPLTPAGSYRWFHAGPTGSTKAPLKRADIRNPLFAAAGPTIDDVDQGSLGNCWLLAGLGAIVHDFDPFAIRQNVVEFDDGTYGVHLGANFYRVDTQLPANIQTNKPVFAQLGLSDSLWVAMVEKAFTYYRKPLSGLISYANVVNGAPNEVNKAFGALPKLQAFSSFADATALANHIRDRFVHSDGVTVAILANATIPGGVPLIQNHGYTVYDIDEDAFGAVVTITLRNPWNNATVVGGLFVTLTPSELFFCALGEVHWGEV